MIKKLTKNIFVEFSLLDFIFFGLTLLACYLLFQQGDLFHTSSSSYAYLKGHFADFYDYNKPLVEVNDYLPLIYIILAIWNLPLKLSGLTHDVALTGIRLDPVELIWTKLLLVIFYFLTAFIIYKIADVIKGDKKKSGYIAAIFVTSPIAVYAVFIFGQYDIIGLFFTMLGFYYYAKNDYLKFSIFFSFAISIKYFPILIFIPLLLLVEKRIFSILKYGVIATLATIVQMVIYLNNEAFKGNILSITSSQISGLLNFNLSPINNSPYLFISFIILCIYAYVKEAKSNEDKNKLSIYLSIISYFIMFSTIMWHPQWFIIIMPFFALSYLYAHDVSKSYLIDIVGMFAFTYILANFFPSIDSNLLRDGVFRWLFPYIPLTNNAIFIRKLIYPFMSIFFVYLMSPLLVQLFQRQNLPKADTFEKSKNHFRARFYIGVAIFIIPSLFCALAPKEIAQRIDPLAYTYPGLSITQSEKPAGSINKNISVKQSFIAENNNLACVSVQLATYARVNICNVTLELRNNNNEVLASEKIEGKTIKDNLFYNFKFNSIKNSKGNIYYIAIESDGTDDNSITAWMSNNDVYPKGNFLINDKEVSGDLCMKLSYEY